MRILQLGKAYPPVNLGGVETTIQLITEGLHNRQIKCDVLGSNDNFKSIVDIKEFGQIYREGLLKKAFSTLFSIGLINRLRKIHKNYNIIHIHHPDPMSAIALWLVRPSSKIVLHWHSDILRQKNLLKIYRPVQSWLLKRSDVIIATSPNYAQGSADLAPYLNKVVVIPIGIDQSQLRSDGKMVDKIKETYFGKKIVLTIGRMSYYKGYEYLIEAAGLLKGDVVLLVIGNGELEEELRSKARYLIDTGKIVFLGKVGDLERNCYLQACDLFVLSSILKTEAFAIVQIEAMALGKPVVSTEIPGSGVHWVNLNGASGITVPIKDSQRFASAITEIIENKELYGLLSVGAKNRFKQKFTQEVMIDSLLDLYAKI